MDKVFSIGSYQKLEVRVDGPEAWIVTVEGPDFRVRGDVYAYAPHGSIVRLFDDMAAHWRGWEGTKSWESLEGELRLKATHNRVSGVWLEVSLRSGSSSTDGWWIRGELGIELSQLDALAAAARACFAE